MPQYCACITILTVPFEILCITTEFEFCNFFEKGVEMGPKTGMDPAIFRGGANLKKLEKMTSTAVGHAKN